MRIKLAFEESLGRTRCWYPISEYQKRSSIKDLIKTISKEFKLPHKDRIELELDGFTLLPRADVELMIRDGDMIRVKPYISVGSKGSKKRPFKSDSNSKKSSSNKRISRSITRNNVDRQSEDGSSSSSESDDSTSEKITKKSKTSHENGLVETVERKEQKIRNRIDSSPDEDEDSDSSSSESSNNEDSEKDSFIVDDSDSSKSPVIPDEKVEDDLNDIDDRSDDSDAEKKLPNSVDNSSISPKKTLDQNTNDQSEKMSTLNNNNEQRRNELNGKVNKRTKDNVPRVQELDEPINTPSELSLKSNATIDMEVETAQSIVIPTKPKDSVSHATRKTLEPMKLKPPMSLSSTSNKRKGYHQGIRNIKPTHVRFEDNDEGIDALKETSNSNMSPQVLVNNDTEVSKTNIDDTNEPMPEDQLPSPRAIITRVDIIRSQNGFNNDQRYSNNLRKKSRKAGKNKQKNNVYYLDDTHIHDQGDESMQIDVNSSTTSKQKVVTNNVNCGLDYDRMEDYKWRPIVNDIIAYKVIELSSTTWTPGLSEFREAKIIDYDPISQRIVLKHQNLNQHGKEEANLDQMNSHNKFQITDEDDEFMIEGQGPTPEILNINWNDLYSVKKVVV
ncbi:coilin isoform X1 [Gigaspora margarita]|uniref:Coilin isoform X1 n=1 Tax=Gigaspora margarita TaxID=4874 RepID=A0A8H3X6R5_GIGMA|nr:coilin isoform X1 [Gigaspora margarita]